MVFALQPTTLTRCGKTCGAGSCSSLHGYLIGLRCPRNCLFSTPPSSEPNATSKLTTAVSFISPWWSYCSISLTLIYLFSDDAPCVLTYLLLPGKAEGHSYHLAPSLVPYRTVGRSAWQPRRCCLSKGRKTSCEPIFDPQSPLLSALVHCSTSASARWKLTT